MAIVLLSALFLFALIPAIWFINDWAARRRQRWLRVSVPIVSALWPAPLIVVWFLVWDLRHGSAVLLGDPKLPHIVGFVGGPLTVMAIVAALCGWVSGRDK